MARGKTTIDYVKSRGNVFADLGLPHPERALLKARLTLQIYRDISGRQSEKAVADAGGRSSVLDWTGAARESVLEHHRAQGR